MGIQGLGTDKIKNREFERPQCVIPGTDKI